MRMVRQVAKQRRVGAQEAHLVLTVAFLTCTFGDKAHAEYGRFNRVLGGLLVVITLPQNDVIALE